MVNVFYLPLTTLFTHPIFSSHPMRPSQPPRFPILLLHFSTWPSSYASCSLSIHIELCLYNSRMGPPQNAQCSITLLYTILCMWDINSKAILFGMDLVFFASCTVCMLSLSFCVMHYLECCADADPDFSSLHLPPPPINTIVLVGIIRYNVASLFIEEDARSVMDDSNMGFLHCTINIEIVPSHAWASLLNNNHSYTLGIYVHDLHMRPSQSPRFPFLQYTSNKCPGW